MQAVFRPLRPQGGQGKLAFQAEHILPGWPEVVVVVVVVVVVGVVVVIGAVEVVVLVDV